MDGSEAIRYLQTPPLNIFKQPDPLKCWKILEAEYPTVAQMARDVLAIPATGVGVERLFNVGRDTYDTCHYRRNRLDGNTIQIIMVIKYFERIGIPLTNPSDDHIVQPVPDLSNPQSGQEDLPTDADQLPADEQLGDNISDVCEWESVDSTDSELPGSDSDSESEG